MSIKAVQEFLASTGLDKLAPISEELLLKHHNPLQIFKEASLLKKEPFLLEVNEDSNYAYVGYDPLLEIKISGEDPFPLIREIFRLITPCRLIGFMAYEAAGVFEKLPLPKGNSEIHDFHFILHRTSYHFNYIAGKLVQHRFEVPSLFCEKTSCNATQVQSKTSGEIADEEFEERVRTAQMYIFAGDAFQIVLSRNFIEQSDASPLDVYEAIKTHAPTPFMYVYEGNDFGVAGASPERLVKVAHGLVETMPIAGTRGREMEASDKAVEQELLNDPKEVAEHMMLVDLGRNDIGIVAHPGSVKVKELMKVRHYPHIMHLVSKVTGKLREGLDALDAIKAVFPAGTLTGAPKIRAMEIIHHLEDHRRGLYGGAVIYLEDLNTCDAFIAIRTAFFKGGIVKVRTGAGIVLDSVPSNEAEETKHKSKGVMKALKTAMGVNLC